MLSSSVILTCTQPVNANQEEEIAELKALIESLQRRVEELEAERKPHTSATRPTSLPNAMSDATSSSHEVTEKSPPFALTAGDFPGSFKLPNSDVSVKIGGYVKLDFIKDLDFTRSGDIFVQTDVPVDGDTDKTKDGETRFNVRQTRLNLDVRAPTQFGQFRSFFEGDFFGSNSNFRIRHAFGELGHALVGQTWSTFMDISAWPESLGFEGPDVAVFARQGQIRWTQPVTERLAIAVAVENPAGDFTDPIQGTDSDDALDEWPDVTAHIRHQGSWGHLQLGGLVREIQFDDGAGQRGDVVGWGTTLSGRIYTVGKDNIQFQGTYGEGVGRYIQGLIGTGSDAAPNSSGGFDAIPAGAIFASYQHWWTDTLRSTIGGEYGIVNPTVGQPVTAIKNFQGAAINLVWNIVPRVTVGTQFAWARNELKDGRQGIARRIQTSAQFDFD